MIDILDKGEKQDAKKATGNNTDLSNNNDQYYTRVLYICRARDAS